MKNSYLHGKLHVQVKKEIDGEAAKHVVHLMLEFFLYAILNFVPFNYFFFAIAFQLSINFSRDIFNDIFNLTHS